MLQIDNSLYIAKGLHRVCYVHPGNKSRLLKIILPNAVNHKETTREIAYYKHLERRGINWDMLPKYYGTEETNLGTGYVFDLIRDFDGTVSKQLSHYFENADETAKIAPLLKKAWLALESYLLDNRILTMTMKDYNILYQKLDGKKAKLVIIDNIGSSDYIPVCKYVPFMARLKINRKFAKFRKSMLKRYKSNLVVREIFSV